MKRKVVIVGIGAGNPDFVTIQALGSAGHMKLFFIPNQGMEENEIARVRDEIIERYVRVRPFRTAPFRQPDRRGDDVAPRVTESRHAELTFEEVDASESGAFLVWSGVSLYETVQQVLLQIRSMGHFELDYEVIPGNSGVQALTAWHKVALCNIGRSILTATGRSIAGHFPNNADTIVCMLGANGPDAGQSDMHWTLYAGMPDELLVSGSLREIVDEFEQVRRGALEGRGWVVETMLRIRGTFGEA